MPPRQRTAAVNHYRKCGCGCDETPLPHREVIEIITSLPRLVREKRQRDGLALRPAADQIGINHATLARFEDGYDARCFATVLPILIWVS